MIFKVLIAATMLQSGIFASNSELRTNVEHTSVTTTSFSDDVLTHSTLTILIEDHAAPHWNLSKEQAWQAYVNGILGITEITPEEHYLLIYEEGILEIVLTDE